nr:MAG TPA: hypothetical protein [Herelleviridae sp.]
MEKDILEFVDKYIEATIMKHDEEQQKLESYGNNQNATYTDVAKAITNLTLGVNHQVNQLEATQEFNLNVLIDALYKADLITDDVLDHIQKALEESEKGEEE